MSKTIDHRIVEMRFDNKQFEAGAKQTMGTLTKLKEALKLPNTAKALEGIDKATKDIRLDGIAAGVEVLEKRFSTLGIVGMRVIENITDGLMGKLHTAVNFVTNSIVSGGIKRAMNIENAHFQLQALLKDETKVQAVMADAMESVDGTAYAYDEAARAASQFSASGVQAGEDMLGALKGITGVAAMTNSDFESIASIFTTVAGNGRLMGDQLLQLSSRGLNAASTLTDYFKEVRGQAGMTEGQVREMVSKGKISFKDFSDAMTWAFGDSAKRANETFTGALSNMKSALARIGAGFISPLVEQNGEMVNLFNALRIKINDVKSALVFDEQRSAIDGMSKQVDVLLETTSKYVQNGKVGFNEITKAIYGNSKSEEDLTSINEKLSESYNKIKEEGYASVDVMKEFKINGINSYGAVRDYINGVINGSIKASKEVTDSLKDIGTAQVNILDVVQMARDGKISYDLFTNSIVNASGALGKESELTKSTITAMMATAKESGKISSETLKEFNKNGINVALYLRKYMKGVEDGTIRASYATKTAIQEISENAELSGKSLSKLADEGVITYDMFQSAMENAYGTEKTLSKQVTDSVLDGLKGLVAWINALDMTKPMDVFYYGVETIKNSVKGLLSVLKPAGKAFSEVFLSFNGDDVVSFAEAIERITSKLKLSEKGSKNLHDAFKGVFDVGKLVADILFKIAEALFSINKPIGATGDGFLGLIGLFGRGLSDLVAWIRSLELLRKTFTLLTNGFTYGMEGLTKLINIGKAFVVQISKLEGINKFINSINSAFTKLGTMAAPYVRDFVNELEQMIKSFLYVGEFDFNDILGEISSAFSRLADKLDNFTVSSPAELIEKMVDKIKSKLKELHDFAMSNEGFASFVNNFIQFAEDLRQALTFDNIFDRVEKIMEIFGKFFNWIKESVGPALADFNAGSVVAAGGGIGMVYAFVKASKAFENLSKSIKSIPDLLGSFKNTLQAYQKDLNASAILKIAAAIAVLAGALVLLSFADPERLLAASAALSLIAGTLLIGITKLFDAMNKGKELNDAVRIFAKGFKSTMKKLGRAVEIRAVGVAIKNFAKSVAIIAVSIIALGLMYRKDKEALMAGVDLVKMISISMVGIMAAMSILGNLLKGGGMTQFSKAALGVLMLSGSLTLVVNALSNLFKIEFPSDWEFKLKILAGIFAGLAGLSIVLALASRISGKGQIAAATVTSFAVLLGTTVLALDKLFKMNFPPDWQEKLTVLGLIFTAVGALMLTIGIASRLAGGTMKAAGTILAISIFIGVIVAALMVLTTIPGDKLIKGATALGVVLSTLGIALYGAGKIAKDSNAPKAILAMAITVGAITAALAVLAMIPAKLLLKGAVALGGMLLVLATDFKAVSNIADEKAWMTVLAMTAIVAEIAYSLFVLSEQPWEGLFAASVSLGAVLLALAESMQIISKAKGIDLNKISLFGLATMALIPIGVALYKLSQQPLDGMVSAALSISSVLLAFAAVLKVISNLEGLNVKKIGEFLLATVALAPIGAALYFLADKDWAGLLAGGIALSMVLTAMGAAFSIISMANPDLKAMATFLLASASVSLIALSLTELANQQWESLLAAGASLSAVLLSMTAAMGICAAIGPVGLEAIAGIAVLDLFAVNFLTLLGVFGEISKSDDAKALLSGGVEIFGLIGQAIGAFVGGIAEGVLTGISSALPQIGSDLSEFMKNLEGFISQAPSINEEVLKGVGILAACIIAITAAEVISGIGFFLGGAAGLVSMALNLVLFINTLEPFLDAVKGIDAESMQAVKSLAEMIIILTAAEMLNGIGQLLHLTGSLSDFGTQLAEFGPYIRDFAETVKDVKPEAVEGAAAAGEIMATLANKLPGSGGILQQFFGEKNLAEFGTQLLAFGYAIVPFADMVKDVKPESVEGAAAAAEIMAELANKLPAQGGFARTIFGEKNLASFGYQLTAFGEAVVPFTEQVADVKASSIQGVRTITAVMTSLANDLPDTQSLWSKIFSGGQMSLSKFGTEIEAFGTSMSNFASNVSGINYNQIDNTMAEINNLLTLSKSLEGANPSAITNFVNGLGNIGTSSVDAFVKAISGSASKINSAISEMINNIITAIRSKSSQFTKSGQNSATFWINGIKSKFTLAFTTGIELAQRVISAIKSTENQFKKAGESSILAYITGMKGMNSQLSTAGDYMAKAAVKGFKSVEDEFSKSGQNAIKGFIDAVNSQMSSVSNLGKQIGDSTAKSAQKSLDEHSPSKRMGQIADYAGIGFIRSLIPYVQKAYDAGEEIGNAVYDGSSSAIQLVREMSDPVIRPSVDLDGVRKSVDEINSMFNDYVKDMNIDFGFVGASIDEKRNSSYGKTEKEVVNNITNNYDLTQNNHSPKALSTVDIYRNTENQFSRLKQSINDK